MYRGKGIAPTLSLYTQPNVTKICLLDPFGGGGGWVGCGVGVGFLGGGGGGGGVANFSSPKKKRRDPPVDLG